MPFFDNPYFTAGTGVPDWLAVADRRVRVRTKHAAPWAADPDPHVAAVAGGVLQHLRDDARFHRTRAFAETTLELTAALRQVLPGAEVGENGSTKSEIQNPKQIQNPKSRIQNLSLLPPPYFLAHLLVEVLLDAALTAECPGRLAAYERTLGAVDPRVIQDAVNRMVPRPTERLAPMIALFRREGLLWDYLEDDKLLVRLNQVMRRVGFGPLPGALAGVLPEGRRLVGRRRHELLDGIPVRD